MDVDAKTFDRWNKEPQPLFLAIGGLLGLAFGALLVRALARPKSPVTELDDALAAGEFRPFMQPVFSLTTARSSVARCWRAGSAAMARSFRHHASYLSPRRADASC